MTTLMKSLLHLCLCSGLLLSSLSHAGFSVSGKNLLDGNGNTFVMRGVNHAHAWYPNQTQALADIAATGANTVRVVLANGEQWSRTPANEVQNIIDLCKANALVCILEVHDTTGYPEQGVAAPMTTATNYWLSSDIKPVIQGEEDYIIINIANEPAGNTTTVSTYVNDTTTAIQALRNGGLTHTLMVDAGNWGQDWQFGMRDNAPAIFNADPQRNTVFSVHMYEVFSASGNAASYMQAFANNNLHLVVGEFGTPHSGQTVPVAEIMRLAEQHGYGYLGWSWSGNGACCYDLDIVSNFTPGAYSAWGNLLMFDSNGIVNTSHTMSLYSGSGEPPNPPPTEPPSASECEWYDGSVWPMCQNDNGGWGWENNQSCVSESACPNPQNGGSGGAAPTQCRWHDGTEWPLCQSDNGNWGWENNQSCVSNSICPEPF